MTESIAPYAHPLKLVGTALGKSFHRGCWVWFLYILTRPLYNHADFSIFVLLVTEKVMLKSQAMLMDLSVLFNSVATSCIWGVCEQPIQTYIFIIYCGSAFYHYQQKEKYFLLLSVFLCVCVHVYVCIFDMCVSLCVHIPVKAREQGWISSSTISTFLGGQGLSSDFELLSSLRWQVNEFRVPEGMEISSCNSVI